MVGAMIGGFGMAAIGALILWSALGSSSLGEQIVYAHLGSSLVVSGFVIAIGSALIREMRKPRK
jgi:hypothetical protein